jgi:hypothetical protein
MSNTHEALAIAEHPGTSDAASEKIRAMHALIVQMAEALEKCRFDSLNMKLADLGEISDAHAAATQYLKGQQ